MRVFEKNEAVFFLKDYYIYELSKGWIYDKGRSENNTQYWRIVTDEDMLSVENYRDIPTGKIYEIKWMFIVKNNSLRVPKYVKFSHFVDLKYISLFINPEKEKSLFIKQYNSKILVFLKCLFSMCFMALKYFFSVIVYGLIKLCIGDIIQYFVNIHFIYKNKSKLKGLNKRLIAITSLNREYGQTVKDEIAILEEELKNRNKEINEINRVLIATIISIISLIVSLNSN